MRVLLKVLIKSPENKNLNLGVRQMKTITATAIFILWTISLFSPGVLQADQKPLIAELENVDAFVMV